MNVLITAGGTREDIDPVRGITNYSTGRLGSLIAEQFSQGGANVTYICGQASHIPDIPVTHIVNTAQLLDAFEKTLSSQKFNCVIHTMAVSDYSPCGVAPINSLDLANVKFEKASDTKISSESQYLAVLLKRQPKAIDLVKKLQPHTILIGAKLLNTATEEELKLAAFKQIKQSGSDYVLANSKEQVTEEAHKAILFNKDGEVGRAKTKQEIAKLIYETVGLIK